MVVFRKKVGSLHAMVIKVDGTKPETRGQSRYLLAYGVDSNKPATMHQKYYNTAKAAKQVGTRWINKQLKDIKYTRW